MNGAALRNILLLARVYSNRRARALWNRLFDHAGYLDSNPDVNRSLYPAALHYVVFGNADRRNPSRCFDTSLYLKRNPDVAARGVNALLQYALFGAREGRMEPCRFFDGPSHTIAMNLPEFRGRSILIALPYLTFGGAQSLFRRIAEIAAESGWTPVIITTLEPPPEMPRNPECFRGVTEHVYELPLMFESQRERLAAVERLIEHYAVEIVMIAGSEAMYHWLPRIKKNTPCLRVVDHLFNAASAHARDNRYFRDHIAATVVQSQRVLTEIRNRSGEPAGKVTHIPLGVEIPPWIHQPEEHAPVIGYVGRLSHEKGPDLFIEIARRLFGRDRNIRFLLAGDGPAKKIIHKMAAEVGIEMTGYVDPVIPLMNRIDVLVIPSRVDGTPAAALEAQALGIPIVAANVGGLADIVIHGRTGFLCEAENIKDFCDRITELARNVDLRKRFGAEARKFVIEQHSDDAMKRRYRDLLNDAAIIGRS